MSENLQTSWDAEHQDALVLVAENGRFALAYGRSRAEAHARARQGLTTNLAQLLSQRLAIYQRLPTRHVPALASPARERLPKKCVSVMKVNTLAPEGSNRQTWSTPEAAPGTLQVEERQPRPVDNPRRYLPHTVMCNNRDTEISNHPLLSPKG